MKRYAQIISITTIFLFVGSNLVLGQNKVDARNVISDWPSTAKKAANAMLDKYGSRLKLHRVC